MALPASETVAAKPTMVAHARTVWKAPVAVPNSIVTFADASSSLERAEALYKLALASEQRQAPEAVDQYFQTVILSWRAIHFPTVSSPSDFRSRRAWNLYHSGLSGLIQNGQQHHRLDPRRGLLINTPTGAGYVSIHYRGFPWEPNDFDRLVVANTITRRRLRRNHSRPGLGLGLVAFREHVHDDRFMSPKIPFAATAVLRPNDSPLQQPAAPTGTNGNVVPSDPPLLATLELIDPLRVDSIEIGQHRVTIRRDISAPLDAVQKTSNANPIRGFLQPGISDSDDGLRMTEPYQRGKIPLIFVHGLLSNRLTWVSLANELRANRWVNDRFQLWTFQYPTGEPFLRSAAKLRRQLTEIVGTLDPHGQDPAMSQMILVGHSMGGLVSKLQVTSSGSVIWEQFSRLPIDNLRATPEHREELRTQFFFGPVPTVQRVIFIGTPHRGSSWASWSIGRLGANLIRATPEQTARHRALVQANPGVIARFAQRRIPTSVDLLTPHSPLLAAMGRLQVNPQVQLHSIIGTGQPMLTSGPADGVVPVASARHYGTSEKLVNTTHGSLPHHRDAVVEILRILETHVREFDTGGGPRSF